MTLRKAIIETLSALILIGGLMALWAMAASAQPLCGTERTIGTVRVHVVCPDWPAMRAMSGFTGFPDAKGQQVFVRSTDPAVTAFRVTMRYRKDGAESAVTQFADVDARYDSGVGWVLGDVEILGVEVVELREAARAKVE